MAEGKATAAVRLDSCGVAHIRLAWVFFYTAHRHLPVGVLGPSVKFLPVWHSHLAVGKTVPTDHYTLHARERLEAKLDQGAPGGRCKTRRSQKLRLPPHATFGPTLALSCARSTAARSKPSCRSRSASRSALAAASARRRAIVRRSISDRPGYGRLHQIAIVPRAAATRAVAAER